MHLVTRSTKLRTIPMQVDKANVRVALLSRLNPMTAHVGYHYHTHNKLPLALKATAP
jgi:hypothetical protein